MRDEPPYILDVGGMLEDDTPQELERQGPPGRPWIGIRFECCGIYTRFYRNREATAYVGGCPRCNGQVRVAIGPGGTSSRMFRAT